MPCPVVPSWNKSLWVQELYNKLSTLLRVSALLLAAPDLFSTEFTKSPSNLSCACQIFALGHVLTLTCHYIVSFLSPISTVGEVIHSVFQPFFVLNSHNGVSWQVWPKDLFDKWRSQWCWLILTYAAIIAFTLWEEKENMAVLWWKFCLLRSYVLCKLVICDSIQLADFKFAIKHS